MVSVLIVILGAITITCLILKYLMWRYGQDVKHETINSQFVKIDDRIKSLEQRIDSVNTKIGARKL